MPTPTKTWKAPGVAEPEPVVEHLDRWLVTPRTVRLGGGAVGPRGRAGEFGVGLEAGGPGRKVLLALGAPAAFLDGHEPLARRDAFQRIADTVAAAEQEGGDRQDLPWI